jgi:hypothetical protein
MRTPKSPSKSALRVKRFAVERHFDGKWAVIDAESSSGILVFCSREEEAQAMLAVLTGEMSRRAAA